MAVIECDVCNIIALNSSGLGIGISNNTADTSKVIEIPYTAPDEVIKFEKHLYKMRRHLQQRNKLSCSSLDYIKNKKNGNFAYIINNRDDIYITVVIQCKMV